MIIPDSNIWIGYFYNEDPHHIASQKLLSEYALENIVVTEYIILEVTTVLKQKKGHGLACAFLDFIDEFEIEVLESDIFYTKTIRLFISLKEKHLSFVDTSLLYLSKKYMVVTFDKHLSKLIKR